MTAMKSWPPLDQLNLDADTKTQVSDIIQTLLDQAQKEIRAQEIKIQALTLELAHLRRIRFGRSNESLTLFPSQSQLDLFEETVQADTAAVAAEIEQLDSSAKPGANKPPRTRAGRQTLPGHLPRIEHRHEPPSCQCGRCGRDLVKIGEDITEQLDVGVGKVFCPSPHSCAICVQNLRNHHCRACCSRCDRWRHGRARPTGMGDD